MASVSDVPQMRAELERLREQNRSLQEQVSRSEERVRALEDEMQESRLLNRRLAELADTVQELLITLAGRDDRRLQDLLDPPPGG
jgi:septation ring formation regulator EzrA